MRQLTSLDSQFLALETRRQTGHVASVAILDPSTTADPVQRLLRTHETSPVRSFRCTAPARSSSRTTRSRSSRTGWA